MDKKLKIKYYRKFIYNRIASIKKYLLTLLLMAIIIIAIVDFEIISFSVTNRFVCQSLTLSVKLSYAYLSSFIFYFIVIHLPSENRKVRVYRQINNKIISIDKELQEINFLILDNTKYEHRIQKHHFRITDLSKKNFIEYAKQTNPQKPPNVTSPYYPPFRNWYDFLTFKKENIQNMIKDILLLEKSIDNEVLGLLIDVDNEVEHFATARVYYANKSLEHLASTIYKATFDCEKLIKVFQKKYGRYRYENGFHYKLNAQGIER